MKWEYRREVISVSTNLYTTEIQEVLNKLGAQGWEVIQLHFATGIIGVYAKRPLPDPTKGHSAGCAIHDGQQCDCYFR